MSSCTSSFQLGHGSCSVAHVQPRRVACAIGLVLRDNYPSPYPSKLVVSNLKQGFRTSLFEVVQTSARLLEHPTGRTPFKKMHSHSSWAEQCSSGSPSLSGERSRTPTPSRAPFSASFTEASDTPSRTDEAREEELPATEAEQQAFLPWHLSDAAPRDAGRIRHAPIVRKPVAVPAISHEPKQDAGDARGPTPHPSNAKELGQSSGKHHSRVENNVAIIADKSISSDLVVSSPVKSIWRIWALEMACLALSIIFFLGELCVDLTVESHILIDVPL